MARSDAEARERLQDAMARLASGERADRYDPARASPISWRATFARNRAIDRLRRTGKHAGQLDLDAAFALADGAPIAEEAMIDAERRAHPPLPRRA